MEKPGVSSMPDQVAQNRLVAVGAVPHEFGHQPQFEPDHRDLVPTDRDPPEVCPRSTPGALVGVVVSRLGWHSSNRPG